MRKRHDTSLKIVWQSDGQMPATAHQYVRHMDVDCATMRLSRVLTCNVKKLHMRGWSTCSYERPSSRRGALGVTARLRTAHALAALLIATCLLPIWHPRRTRCDRAVPGLALGPPPAHVEAAGQSHFWGVILKLP